MTQKTTGRVPPDPNPNLGPSPEELQTAYQIHTLAQYLYGQVAVPQQPWFAAMPPTGGFQTMPGTQPAPWPQQTWPAMGYAQPWYTQPWQAPYAATPFQFGFQAFPR